MTADSTAQQRQVARNVAIHDRVARRYDAIHGEIFNDIEQARLREVLARAKSEVRTGREPLDALDFGCGSGNLTRHLLALGMKVTAADVSRGFLDLVASRYPQVTTHWMQEGRTADLADCSFDFIATYSVLHHIPDYLAACAELARLCRPGGVVLIDHETSEGFWRDDPAYARFRKAALRFDWRKYLSPANYWHRLRRVFDPRHSNEGDIHVWPDDHVEWPKVTALMREHGLEPVIEQDYLLARRLYRAEVYASHCASLSDTRVMAFRKCAA
jgi:SAM-dependent methyltransferase